MRDWPVDAPDLNAPASGVVHCWRIPTSDIDSRLESRLATILGVEEQSRMTRFRSAEDRRRFVAAHAGARILLSTALGTDPRALSFKAGQFGKPALDSSTLEFNLSHSGRIALVAVCADAAVGIDVEELRPIANMDALAKDYFHPAESADLAMLGEAKRALAFYRTWTRKEAVAKAIGLGLNLDLNRFRVSCDVNEPARLRALPPEYAPAHCWSLVDLDPEIGHVAALALPKSPVRLVCRSLNLAA